MTKRIFVILAAVAAVSGKAAVKLPIEVVGADGTETSVSVDVPDGLASQARSLWMQVHGLEYDDMASVRINDGAWARLNNRTAIVAEPGKSYGGIGGGFATLKLTLGIPEGRLIDHCNTIRFRFNRSNGVSSGFRVLALNFLTLDGRAILPADAFVEDDPNTWTPPFPEADSIAAGKKLWQSAALTGIRAHCADCHTEDGRDLKYFNFSNASIVARSRFHGLTELQGRQIASYIRALDFPSPGRPWNPPYQPGPGQGAQPEANRAAGAGLKWVLDGDAETLPFVFPGMAITPAAFQPDGHLDAREIPIAFELPDWNHWLPRVHPIDAFGEHFESSAFAQWYAASDRDAAFFDKWARARSKFLPHLPLDSKRWSAELADKVYSAQLWQLVKTWEMAGAGAWSNSVPYATAPSEVNIPDGPAGMEGSALTNEYFSNAWYELQVVLNDGGHRHHGKLPIDWVYLIGHYLDLERFSRRPEPGRLLVAVVQAMQSTDPHIDPHNVAEGWRPEQNVDPRILIDAEWAPMFATLPPEVKASLTESLLAAWLDKTLQYPAAAYFTRGLTASSYSGPAAVQNISGGRVWEAAERFEAAGVSARQVERLREWGRAYTSAAELFHY
jgi:cytochrome c553